MSKGNERDEQLLADTWTGRDAEFEAMVDGWCREREVAEGRRSIGTNRKAREGAGTLAKRPVDLFTIYGDPS